jgi:lipoprotein signal peptidase
MTIIITSILSLLFIAYIALNIFPSSHSLAEGDFTAFVVTITYPILDLMLFVPSMIILISLRKDNVQYIPWIMLSLSLLVNAVADEGYLNDFVNGRLHNLLFWNIFYVADFIIMAGAILWYYRFYISPERRKMKIIG